ncbi:helix-turn-helix domain-containing protein [Fulvivirga sp. M361]|uniref:XRE family transcriptional regulator n=1 Tax=Fulvivirga sp. M361 TaxID=2594266 RepID=UPI00117B9844|nr:helix-turn-helix domain-containing protein [Fulvivirga sp. M361]TRX59218.1 helix-turn-helix domain-containing protein [Fulvivirga sp. M361]
MIRQTLKKLRGLHKMSQKQLANEIGINRSTLADYETGASEPNIETLKRFSEYFNITLDQLINGNGNKSSNQGLKVLAVTVDAVNNENIELIPEKAKAGYLDGYSDPEFIKTLPKFHFPNLPTGTYRAFEIKGNSMPPINDGFIVIGKYVESFTEIVNNRRYILITMNEGIVFKRIKKNIKSLTELILISDNLSYPPYSINKDEIMEIWSFYSFIGFPDDYHSHVIEDIFEKLEVIDNKIENLVKN